MLKNEEGNVPDAWWVRDQSGKGDFLLGRVSSPNPRKQVKRKIRFNLVNVLLALAESDAEKAEIRANADEIRSIISRSQMQFKRIRGDWILFNKSPAATVVLKKSNEPEFRGVRAGTKVRLGDDTGRIRISVVVPLPSSPSEEDEGRRRKWAFFVNYDIGERNAVYAPPIPGLEGEDEGGDIGAEYVALGYDDDDDDDGIVTA